MVHNATTFRVESVDASALPTTLTATQIGYGSASNLLTGSPDLTWDDTAKMLTVNGALRTFTTSDAANLWVSSGSAGNGSNIAAYQFGGATNIMLRIGMRGSTSAPNIIPSSNYGSLIIGTQDTTVYPAGGTHGIFSQLVIKPLTISGTGSTVTNSATLYIAGAATGATQNYSLWIPAGLNRIDNKLTVGGVLNTDATNLGRINSHSDASIYGLYVKAYNSTYAARIEGDVYSNRNTGVYVNKCSPAIRIENSTLGLYYYTNVYPLAFDPAIETSWALELYVTPPAYGVDYPTLVHAALKIREYTPNYAVSIGTIEGLNVEVRYQGIDTITVGGARVSLRKMYGINLAMSTTNGTGGATPGYVTDAYFIYMPAGALMDNPTYYTNVWGIYSATPRAMHYLNSRVGIKILPVEGASGYDLHVNGTSKFVNTVNLATSTAPASPVNGDIWYDGTNLKMQLGGTTKTFTII
jgi:hypothetical protein